MLNLLKIEWRKLKNYRTFWILFILYLGSIVGVNYIAYRIQQEIYNAKQAKGMAQLIVGDIPYSFPTVWQMTAYVSSFLLFIPGLLVIISMSNEYSYKTHRQNIIDGWNRRSFISVKMLLAILLAAISSVFVVFAAILFGLIEGSNSFSTDKMIYIFYYFIQALSYNMVALFITTLVKRGGLAIGIYFLYTVVIENVLKLVLNYYFETAGKYLPLQSADELIPAPVFENIQKELTKPLNYPLLYVMVAVYLAAYFYFTARKFETDDL